MSATTTTKTQWKHFALVAALGSALLWVWWRRRVESLWRQPQPAPLSAQWLAPNRPGYVTV